MKIEIWHIQSQNIRIYIVCQRAVRLVYTTQVVEVSALSKRALLIGIAPLEGGLSGEINQPFSDPQLTGNVAGMLFCWARDSCQFGLGMIIVPVPDDNKGASQGLTTERVRYAKEYRPCETPGTVDG